MSSEVDVVVHLRSLLGESPVWDHRIDRLAWVDILGGYVHLTGVESGRTSTFPVGPPVGAIALLGEDEYLLAIRDGFSVFSDGRLVGLESVAGRGLRMNDGGVDPGGRFLAGSMALDSTPGAGTLYVREPDGTVRALLGGLTISNGLAWSADGTTLFYVDSARQRIDMFDYDVETAAMTNRRPLVEIPQEDGTPDGLTLDADGCVWVALWGGGKVRRYSPDGRLDREVALPVRRVSACGFGGPNLDRLFVTTAAAGATPHTAHELDGALFVVDPRCVGVASAVAS